MRKLIHLVTGFGLFAGVSAAALALAVLLRLGSETYGLVTQVSTLKNGPMALSSEVFDRAGTKIGEFADERRYYARLADLPPHLISAFLSTEDKDFRHHYGVSPAAILRSAIADLKGGALRQGASTITQQLARVYYLDQTKTWERKAKEALLALAIERKLAKDEILELYLNRIYLGNHSYGVEAASRNYFRKHASELDVGEAALLAGLPQSPSRYAPNRHPAAANRRQAFVLKRMEADGVIAAGEAESWAAKVVKVYDDPEDFSASAPYFTQAVRQELTAMLEGLRLPEEGLKIVTTLDAPLQRAAATELASALGVARAQVVKATKHKAEIQGALFSLDPLTGAVLAMQGGCSFGQSQFNRAEGTKRRMAGMFVPLYVALALDKGYTLLSRVGDDPMSGRRMKESAAAPTLYDVLRRGLYFDAVPLYGALGGGTVLDYALRLGMRFDREDPTLALGYGEATPAQVATAYASFVNGGRLPHPYLIERVETAGGKILYQAPHEPMRRVLSQAGAFAAAEALRDATLFGHGAAVKAVAPAAAGAAAATDDLHDAWFVGLLPGVATAVWIGAENGVARLGEGEVAAVALPIDAWVTYMKAAPPAYTRHVPPPAVPGDVAFVRRPAANSDDGAKTVPVPSGEIGRL